MYLFEVEHYNLYDFLDDLSPYIDVKVDIYLDDEVIRGMTVVKDGEITFPPPKIEVSASPKAEEKKVEPKKEQIQKKSSILPGVIALLVLFLVGAFAPESFMNHFTVFVLSCFVF